MTSEEWLDRLKQFFASKGKLLATKLEAETTREKARAEELQKVLEATKELSKARAENTRLRKEIADAGVVKDGKDKDALPVKPPRQRY